jgi:uncharacterized membrane protein
MAIELEETDASVKRLPEAGAQPRINWVLRNALYLALLAQALLLFSRLELLPLWTDEAFTLETVPQSLAQIVATLVQDVHPPLYYFGLHFWQELPIPGSPIGRARAFSVFWLLLATVAVDRFWLRDHAAALRARFLTFWTLSPCLLLYGRMARSYSLQLLLGTVTLYAGCRLLKEPENRRSILRYSAAGILLLYTHYVPGIAIPAAICVVGAVEVIRRRRVELARSLLIAHLVIAAAYLPWILTMGKALRRWENNDSVYMASGNPIVEQLIKLGQWLITFGAGETFPAWGLWLALFTMPFLAIAVWRGRKPVEPWAWIVLCTALFGYLGVSRWVSFPFVPARLLFIYPFFLLLLAKGAQRGWLSTVLVILWIGGIGAYFSRDGFLNKGYNLPIDQMAALINQGATSEDLIVLDACNSDAGVFVPLIRNRSAIVFLSDLKSADRILQTARRYPAIWYWRNTHDTCPGQANRQLESRLESGFEATRHLFVHHRWLEKTFIKLMGWPEQPTHFYQILSLRRRPGG